jgi:hypothetical protein
MVPSVATEKIPSVTPPGIDPETVQLVAQCLNHYATPGSLSDILGNYELNLFSGQNVSRNSTCGNTNTPISTTIQPYNLWCYTLFIVP